MKRTIALLSTKALAVTLLGQFWAAEPKVSIHVRKRHLGQDGLSICDHVRLNNV